MISVAVSGDCIIGEQAAWIFMGVVQIGVTRSVEMNRALCKAYYKSHFCRGSGCGDLTLKYRGRACTGTAQSVLPEWRKFHSKLSDPQKIGQSSLPPSPLSLPLPFKPVAALSSSLKFFRFSGEDSRKSSQVGFQENGDAIHVNLEGTGSAASSDEELDTNTCMDSSALKSVDMSNLLSLAVAEAESSGEDADARVEMMRSAHRLSRPLIQNFAKLSSFWRKDKSKGSKTDTATRSSISIETCQFIPPSCGCQSCGASCSESGLNAANLQVMPHSEVARNKDYFGTFLYRVPSAERKRITQMALLSNLAYRIPSIEVCFLSLFLFKIFMFRLVHT